MKKRKATTKPEAEVMENPLVKIEGDMRWNTGKSQEVAADVLRHPETLPFLMHGLRHDEQPTRMRVAYTLIRIAREEPAIFSPYIDELLDRIVDPTNNLLARTFLVDTLGYLTLCDSQKEVAIAILKDCLYSDSSMVKTYALQSLAHFAQIYPELRGEVYRLLCEAREGGTPAMRARARKILRKYAC